MSFQRLFIYGWHAVFLESSAFSEHAIHDCREVKKRAKNSQSQHLAPSGESGESEGVSDAGYKADKEETDDERGKMVGNPCWS